ncbi:MAG: DNA-binding response regulator, NarL/FixJ family [Dehalococcoidales bacterium]|nr:DNA-binding response regulator, NarL/FixJ family [Dehalococcoidales bacterium]
MIKVLIVDDHALIRSGLCSILGAESDISVVGEARDGVEAVSKALELKPDVVIMDLFMPRSGGLDATRAIREELPGARVLLLTISERPEDVFPALRLGAQGYLLKNSSITEIVDAVRRTAAGEKVLSPAITGKLIDELKQPGGEPQLSPREIEVLHMLGEGLDNTDISQRMFIGESTVRTYIHRLLEKLQLKNRAQLISYAQSHLF